MTERRIGHSDMQRAIELARLIADTRRRPLRSKRDVIYALCFFAGALAQGDTEAVAYLIPRLEALIEELKAPIDV